MHRSGTSLVRRILNSHPRIYCGPEIMFFRDWYEDYFDDPIAHLRFFRTASAMLERTDLFRVMGKAFIEIHDIATKKANKHRWADKNPANVLYLNEWEQLLGKNWLFIHVVRNPLDTIASITDANFKFSIPSQLEARIDYFNKYSIAGLNFYNDYPDKSYRIVYEKLVTEPGKEIEKLMLWLGETFTPAQLDFNASDHQRGLEDPKIQKTKRIHMKGVGRWDDILSTGEIQIILDNTNEIWKLLDAESFFPLVATR